MLKDNIKKVRENNSLSQRELARTIKMSSQMISKIERGETTPSLETLNKIANALGVTISELVETKENSFSINIIAAIAKAYINKNNEDPKRDIFKILSEDLDLDVELFNIFTPKVQTSVVDHNGVETFKKVYNEYFDSSKELPVNIRLRLLDYLSEIDYETFLEFFNVYKDTIYLEEITNKIEEIMSHRISTIEKGSAIKFKEYLYQAFGRIIDDLNADNLKELEEETGKFLEFALFKLKKENSKDE